MRTARGYLGHLEGHPGRPQRRPADDAERRPPLGGGEVHGSDLRRLAGRHAPGPRPSGTGRDASGPAYDRLRPRTISATRRPGLASTRRTRTVGGNRTPTNVVPEDAAYYLRDRVGLTQPKTPNPVRRNRSNMWVLGQGDLSDKGNSPKALSTGARYWPPKSLLADLYARPMKRAWAAGMAGSDLGSTAEANTSRSTAPAGRRSAAAGLPRTGFRGSFRVPRRPPEPAGSVAGAARR
jgi:hypothetical protein